MIKTVKTISIIVLILLANLAKTQTNLVPNPSFEDTVQCPQTAEDVSYATGWINARNSPDYFNSCANADVFILGVPNNFAGSQYAIHGNGYAGVITYHKNFSNMREFIGIAMNQQLIVGTKYYASAYISRADTVFGSDTTKCATNNFGFMFSNTLYSPLSPIPISNNAHVFSNDIITNKTGWTRIIGGFVADSTYQYVYLGNFFNDAMTDTAQCDGYAYYYTDFICVSTDSLYCANAVGLTETHPEIELPIYPNPTTDKIYIDAEPNDIFSYYITDISGKFITSGTLCFPFALSLSSFSKGLYLINLLNKKKTTTRKIIKQ